MWCCRTLFTRITGDIFWADHLEEIAFNIVSRYHNPNMVLSDSESHGPGIANWGPFLNFNPFSSRCCQHNHTQGALFSENLWIMTMDWPLELHQFKCKNDTQISINNKTKYPFDDNLLFEFKMDRTLYFKFHLQNIQRFSKRKKSL